MLRPVGAPVDLGEDKHGRRRWRLSVYVGRDERGRQVRRTETFYAPSRRAAERRLAVLETAARASRVAPTRRTSTVAELMARWLDHCRSIGRSPTTIEGAEHRIRNHIVPAIGAVPIDELGIGDVNALYHAMTVKGLAPATVRQAHAALRAALQQAMRWELVDRNVAALASPPMLTPPSLAVPEPAAVRAVLAEVPAAFAVPVRLLAATGARRSEVLALTWSDVDLDASAVLIDEGVVVVDAVRTLKSTKTRNRRIVSLDPQMVELLRAERAAVAASWTSDVGPLWVCAPTPGEGHWHPDTISHAWSAAARRAGVVMPLKNLRHFAATTLLDAGVPIATVAARLGHTDGGRMTLARYAARTAGADRRSAEVLGAALWGD